MVSYLRKMGIHRRPCAAFGVPLQHENVGTCSPVKVDRFSGIIQLDFKYVFSTEAAVQPAEGAVKGAVDLSAEKSRKQTSVRF